LLIWADCFPESAGSRTLPRPPKQPATLSLRLTAARLQAVPACIPPNTAPVQGCRRNCAVPLSFHSCNSVISVSRAGRCRSLIVSCLLPSDFKFITMARDDDCGYGGPPVIIECLWEKTHGLAVTRLQQHCLSQTQSQSGGGGESSHYHRQCQSTMHDTVSQVQVRAMEVEVVSCLQVHPPLPSAASLPSTWLLRDAVPAADESCSSSEGGLSQPTVAACRLWQCGERQAMQAQALQPGASKQRNHARAW